LHANSFRGICIKSTNEQAKDMQIQLIKKKKKSADSLKAFKKTELYLFANLQC